MKFLKQKEAKVFVIANFGIFFLTVVINFFAWKFKLVSAGISGYALAVSYMTGLSVGTLLLVMNGIIMLLNWIVLGKSAGIKALYGYIVFSLCVDATRVFLHLTQTPVDSFIQQTLLMAILAVLISFFISLIIVSGYSVGSYSALHPVVNKYIRITPSKMFFICDFILTVITAILFGVEKAIVLLIHASVLSVSLKYMLPNIQKLLQPLGIKASSKAK